MTVVRTIVDTCYPPAGLRKKLKTKTKYITKLNVAYGVGFLKQGFLIPSFWWAILPIRTISKEE